MSDFRRACVIHQPQFFQNDVYKNIKTRNDKSKPKRPPTIVNNKRYHANLLYNQWSKNEKKTIISRRLGISYEQTIHARVDNETRRTFNKHMYKKKLFNFSLCRSNNTHVSKAQKTCFERAKRRIFNSKEHNPQNRRHHRLITSQRYRFLYTASQSINKPIKHLQYTHGWDLSNYKFRIPLSKCSLPQRSLVIEDVSFMNPTLTVDPYNPIPVIPFPEKFNKIIPKDPIYNKQGVYIFPGSREWFTYMHDLHKNLPPPLTKAQKRAKRLRDEAIQRDIQAHDDAIYHGTSFNRISRRIAAKDALTKINLQFDEMMKEYIELYFKYDDMRNKNHYHTKMVECAYNSSGRRERYDWYLNTCSRLPTGASNDTSDDTIKLEKRHKKH
ncbi:unnamed protein product [Rhizophagus irregularis]|uniref:DUF8211 domain-containing protein n=1 Tax=Rhizophagus irregularis TaxID=588596 RepID=A0A2N1MHL1_9GLOM|nr:hypothetical protein RhiirC2_792259 [Rhizophagus irregularis]CAB4384021.1 unnamed protein product [Rhizophagus irregularis]CAB5361090.1 unnamed protein product [Rhizophagus irregularis]